MLKSGIKSFDKIFGGIREGEVVHVFGEKGSGKTSLALQFARNLVRSRDVKVLYVYTEGKFPVLRLKQICGEYFDEVAKKVIVLNERDFWRISDLVDKLLLLSPIFKMIVLDTIARPYVDVLLSGEKGVSINVEVARQVALLRYVTKRYKLFTMVLNRVQNVVSGPPAPIAGSIVSFWSDIDIRLMKSKQYRNQGFMSVLNLNRVVPYQIKYRGLF
ncbi:MAG: ATPase domain-containing protein [Candidatus Asgardarchaeia archaeon]